jgi:Ca2+-binding EF-hand superfamily protein
VIVVFKMYDQDRNGEITQDELKRILRVVYGDEFISDEKLNSMVRSILRVVDVNKDGKLNFKEFKLKFQRSPYLIQVRYISTN